MTTDMRTRLLASDLRALIAPDLLADPYPAYEQLRGAPVRLRCGTVVVTGHADATTVLRSEAFVKESMPRIPGRTMGTVAGLLIMLNPPEHTRLRSAAGTLIPADAMATAERRAQEFTTAVLTAGRGRDRTSIDVVADLAAPLAMAVISDLVDAAATDGDTLRGWAQRFNQAVDTPVPLRATRLRDVPGVMRHQQTGVRTLTALRRAVRYAERTVKEGQGGFVTSLRALVADGTITEREAAAMWIQILLAGIDTVQTMVASAIWLLGQHPEQYELLAADPGLLPATVDEVLRFESPTRLFGRVVGSSVDLGGLALEPGDDVVVVFGAANRDPDAFPDPQRFDITRPRVRTHIAFGHGIHFCLGAQLARAEGTGALRALVEVLGDTPPRVDGAEWRRSYFFRSLDRLRLQVELRL